MQVNEKSQIDGVWLIDFGISADLREDSGTDGEVNKDDLKTWWPEIPLGTKLYMASEQWNRQRQDGRTDVYALGVTAYQLLAGNVPFSSADGDDAKLYAKVMNEKAEKIPGVPSAVDEVVQKAIAKQTNRRYNTCTEFIQALKAAFIPKVDVVPKQEVPKQQGIITIQPGKYEFSRALYVNKTVTFRGSNGRAEDVVIECPGSNTFFAAKFVKISSLTLR